MLLCLTQQYAQICKKSSGRAYSNVSVLCRKLKAENSPSAQDMEWPAATWRAAAATNGLPIGLGSSAGRAWHTWLTVCLQTFRAMWVRVLRITPRFIDSLCAIILFLSYTLSIILSLAIPSANSYQAPSGVSRTYVD